MTKLQQLESNLIQHEQQKKSILNQINDEKQIEKTKSNSQYNYLINNCFKKKYSDVEMFKILNIIDIIDDNNGKTLKVKILKVEPNLIQIVDKMLDDLYIEPISSETFESHLNQIVNNVIQFGTKRPTMPEPSSESTEYKFETSCDDLKDHVANLNKQFGANSALSGSY